MSRREQARVDRELFKDFGDFDTSSDEEEEQIRSHMRELAEIHRQELRMRRDLTSNRPATRFPPPTIITSIPTASTTMSDDSRSQTVQLAEDAYGPEWKGLVKEIVIVNKEDLKKEEENQETVRRNQPSYYDSDADESSEDDDTQENTTSNTERENTGMRSYINSIWENRYGWFNLPRFPKK